MLSLKMSVANERRRVIDAGRGPNHGSRTQINTSSNLNFLANTSPHQTLFLIPTSLNHSLSTCKKDATNSARRVKEPFKLQSSVKIIDSTSRKDSLMPMRTFRSSKDLKQIIPSPTERKEKKSNKPQMEKRRRQRINDCLDELKEFVLDVYDINKSRQEKLEKADILEMTVKYFRHMKSNGKSRIPLMINGEEPGHVNTFEIASNDPYHHNSDFGARPELGNCFNIQSTSSQVGSSGERRVMLLVPVPLPSSNQNLVNFPNSVNTATNDNSTSNEINIGEIIQQDNVSSGSGSAPVIQLSITNNISGCRDCSARELSSKTEKIPELKYCIGRNSPDTTTSDEPDNVVIKDSYSNSPNFEGHNKTDSRCSSASSSKGKRDIQTSGSSSYCLEKVNSNLRPIAPKPIEDKPIVNLGIDQNQMDNYHHPEGESMWRPW